MKVRINALQDTNCSLLRCKETDVAAWTAGRPAGRLAGNCIPAAKVLFVLSWRNFHDKHSFSWLAQQAGVHGASSFGLHSETFNNMDRRWISLACIFSDTNCSENLNSFQSKIFFSRKIMSRTDRRWSAIIQGLQTDHRSCDIMRRLQTDRRWSDIIQVLQTDHRSCDIMRRLQTDHRWSDIIQVLQTDLRSCDIMGRLQTDRRCYGKIWYKKDVICMPVNLG